MIDKWINFGKIMMDVFDSYIIDVIGV